MSNIEGMRTGAQMRTHESPERLRLDVRAVSFLWANELLLVATRKQESSASATLLKWLTVLAPSVQSFNRPSCLDYMCASICVVAIMAKFCSVL